MAKRHVYREPVVQPLDQSIKLIPLTKGQVTVVDASEYDRLMEKNWRAYWHPRTKTFYATLNHAGTHMQRIIMGAKRGQLVDHRNGDTLDNRRENLRFATCSQNSQNRKVHCNNKHGVKGVYWRKDMQQWQASIMLHGKRFHLGHFSEMDQAIAARKAADEKYHGEFARTTYYPH